MFVLPQFLLLPPGSLHFRLLVFIAPGASYLAVLFAINHYQLPRGVLKRAHRSDARGTREDQGDDPWFRKML
jgi:hypothetical protein